MAWVVKTPGGRHKGMYRDNAGKARSAGTYDSEKRAKTEATNKEALARSKPKQAHDMTWKAWREAWLPTLTIAQSTRDTYEYRISKHLGPRWDGELLHEIERHEVQEWVHRLEDYLKPATIRTCMHILSHSLKDAQYRGFIDANPCAGVRTPRDGPSPERFLSKAECDAIRSKLPAEDWLMFDLLLLTGLRWGELTGLHWDHVDFENKRLRVEMQYQSREHTFRPTKTTQTRWVPLTDKAVALLKARLGLVGWGTPSKAVYDRVRVRYGPVFVDKDGLPVTATKFRRHLHTAARKAVVEDGGVERPVGAVRVHDLRHTYASRLVQSGRVDIQTVGALLGHSGLRTTQRYAKVADARWSDVRDVLN